ncbi:MAG: hypothetical protein V1838_01720 [Patescibacteria group bacterium]
MTNQKDASNILAMSLIAAISAFVLVTAVLNYQSTKDLKEALDRISVLESRNTTANINTTANANTVLNTNTAADTDTVIGTNTNTSTDATADWQTYTNSRYSYSIKYPNNWHVDNAYSESDFTYRAGCQCYIGGDVSWSNYIDPSQYTPDTIPNDIQSTDLLIWKVGLSSTVDDFINSNFLSGYYSKETFITNGITVTRLYMNDDSGQNSERRILLLQNGENLFQFTYGVNGSLAIMEDMVSTFQFTD